MSRSGGTSTSEGRAVGGASSGERLLRAESSDGQLVAELRVGVDQSHTMEDLASAITAALGWPGHPPGAPLCRRRGFVDGWLPAEKPVLQSDVLTGDTIVFAPPQASAVRPRSAADLEIVVASGPDTGRWAPLEPGQHLLGRDRAALLPLTDSTVSRRHALIEVDGDSIRISSADAGPGVWVCGRRVTEPTTWRTGQPVRLGSTTVVVRRPIRFDPLGPDRTGHLPFQRTPYFPEPVAEVTIKPFREIPTKPEPAQPAYVAAAAPLIMGVAMATLFGQPRFLLFAVLSPLMIIGSFIDQRRRNAKRYAASLQRFEAELIERTAEVEQALADERRRRLLGAPDVADLWARVEARSADLWVRGRAADDFLRLRVGLGELATSITTPRPDGGEPEIRDRIDEAFGRTDTLADVPVAVDLLGVGTLGVAGRVADTTMLVNSLIVQACALHSPEDLVVAAAVDAERDLHRWMHWLPHTRSASSPLAGPHLAWSPDAAEDLLAEIMSSFGEAIDTGRSESMAGPTKPHLLLILDQRLQLDPALVARLLDAVEAATAPPGSVSGRPLGSVSGRPLGSVSGRPLGSVSGRPLGSVSGRRPGEHSPVSVIWLAGGPQQVPRQARALLTLRPVGATAASRLDYTDQQFESTDLEPERLGGEAAGSIARSLAPIRDASSAGAATALPRVTPLFSALGLGQPSASSVAKRVAGAWAPHLDGSANHLRLSTPIGMAESGPLVIDLVAQGPHALIGGTSGSGKSELLMSLVAGLMAWQPPSRVNLLFIDYKGGASSDVFREAPHTVGYVTNLDGDRSRRALVSLRAELDRRMELLQGRAKDLADMVARHPTEAPPALVIVVDEFATLVKEIPDFVAGIIDIAQRGRSLGIHLVLATQRPSGSIDDNIKANTNLRIALRMLDAAESNAVIGAPDAAAIPNPLRGRGYVSFGAGELVAFQSAWSGAPLPVQSGATGPAPIAIEPWPTQPDWGRPGPTATPGAEPPIDSGISPSQSTQLDVLLEAVAQATAELGLGPGRAPWLDELAEEIPLSAVRAQGSADSRRPAGRQVTIGMVDDPERQRHYRAVLDLAAGGTMVVGGAGSGKSTLLRTIAISAALDDADRGNGTDGGETGSALTLFVFDFASRELVDLQRLARCAGVATGDNIEALTRYLDVLDAELERRRNRLAEAIAQGRPAPEEGSVLILIDDYEVLTGLLDQSPASTGLADYGPRLTRLLTEGRSVGLFPVLSVPRAGAVRTQVASALSNRIVLRQADPQGYGEAGIASTLARELDLRPGQAIINGTARAQIAQAGPDDLAAAPEKPPATPEHGVALAGSLASSPLPQQLGLLPQPGSQPLQPIVGLVDLTGEPLVLDLRRDNLAIVGEPRSGRSTAAATIAHQAAEASAEVWVLAPPWSPLTELVGAARRCVVEGAERLATLSGWRDDLGGGAGGTNSPPRLLVVDDVDLLGDGDPQLAALLEPLLSGLRWVAVSATPRGFNPSPVAQLVRQARSLVYLQPTDRRDAHEVLGFNPPWHPGLAMPPGRGLVSVDRRAVLAQFSNTST